MSKMHLGEVKIVISEDNSAFKKSADEFLLWVAKRRLQDLKKEKIKEAFIKIRNKFSI